MKISGKFILKVAGTLTVISLVVAALLGLVNNVTADKIAAIDAENTKIAMSAVAPEGSEFGDKLDITDDMAAAASAQGGKLVELYPVTKPGQLIFGVGCGLLTCFIRRFGSYPEGVCYSILIMNCTTWLLDKYIRHKIGRAHV